MISEKEKTDQRGFMNWMMKNNIRVLNVAGPRESSGEGTYKFAYKVLEDFLFSS